MNGGGELSGFVEIYHNNQWGRVCDQAWSVENAIATCVQLGHNGAIASPTIPSGIVSPMSGLVWLVRIMCDGDDDAQQPPLTDCTGGRTWLGQTDPCQSAYVECVPFADSYLGCFWDNQQRILRDFSTCSDNSICHDCDNSNNGCFRRDMTVEYCLDLCCMRDYAFAGLESAHECYCGNSDSQWNDLTNGRLENSRCNQRCAGDPGTRCGGAFEIQMYTCEAWNGPATRCEVPPAPENGFIEGALTVYAPGDIITFSCDPGYNIVGQPASLTCGVNGLWNTSPPQCQSIVCPVLQDYSNAIPSTTLRAYNTVVTFTCDVGNRHVRNQPAQLICGDDATWTGITPLCRDENDCNVLPDYADTTPSVVDGTAVGITITFTCSSGLLLVDNVTMVKTCTEPRTWIGLDPVCQDIDECLENPCQNGGRCQNTEGDYSCICTSGHTGKNCEFADVPPTETPTNGTDTGNIDDAASGFPTYAWVTILIVCIVLLLIFIAWAIIFRSRRKSRAKSDPRLLPNRNAAVSSRQYSDAYQNGQNPRYGSGIKPGNKHSGEYGNNAYTDSLPAFSSATQDRTPSTHQRVTVPPGPSIGAGIARNVDRLPDNTQHRDRSAFQPPRDRQRTAAKPLVVLAQSAGSPQSSPASTPRSTRRAPLPMTSQGPTGNAPPPSSTLARPVARNPSAVSSRGQPIIHSPSAVTPIATQPIIHNPSALSSSAHPVTRNPSAVSHVASRPVARNPSAVSSSAHPTNRNPSAMSPVATRPVVRNPSVESSNAHPITRNPSAVSHVASRPVARNPSAVSPVAKPVARNPSALSTSNRPAAAIGTTEKTGPVEVLPDPIILDSSDDSSVEESPVQILPAPSPTKPVRRFPSNIEVPRPVQPQPTITSTPRSPTPVTNTPRSPPPVAPKPLVSPNAVRVLPPKTARAIPRPNPQVQPSANISPYLSPDENDADARRARLTSDTNVLSPAKSHKRTPSFNKNIDSELQKVLLSRRKFSTSDEDSADDSRGPLLSPVGLRPGPSTGALRPGPSSGALRPTPSAAAQPVQGSQPSQPAKQQLSAGELAGAPLGDSPRSASPVDSLDGQGDGKKGEDEGEEKKEKDMLDEFFDGVKEKFDDCTIS